MGLKFLRKENTFMSRDAAIRYIEQKVSDGFLTGEMGEPIVSKYTNHEGKTILILGIGMATGKDPEHRYYYIDIDPLEKQIIEIREKIPRVVQYPGTSTMDVMSQKSITDILANTGTGVRVVQNTGTSLLEVMSQNAVTVELDHKASVSDIPHIVQNTGSSTEWIMSQKATTDAITNSITVTVVQTTGSSTQNVMSQNAVTTYLASKASYSDIPVVLQSEGTSQQAVMSQNAVTYFLSGKASKSDIPVVVQDMGTNEETVMSQNAVTQILMSHQDEIDGKINLSAIVQVTGTSETDIMSQEAVTDALDLKVNKTQIVQATGTSETDIISQKAVTDALNLKIDDSQIVQATGTSETDIMSQEAVTGALDLKVDKTQIVQVTGTSGTDVMSQSAVSSEFISVNANMSAMLSDIEAALALKVDDSQIVQVTGTSETDIMSQKAVTALIGTDITDLKDELEAEITEGLAQKVDRTQIVQATGTSETDIMSQKAVTDTVDENITELKDELETEITEGLALKVDRTQIVQETGISETDIMSQKAVTDTVDEKITELKDELETEITEGLALKIDRTQIVQATGTSETDIMSQNAVTSIMDVLVYQETEWETLHSMLQSSGLVRGRKYLITDFRTSYITPVTGIRAYGEAEPLAVTAESANTLSPLAFSSLHPGDTVYYDINNDTSRYAWAVTDGTGKGVIYRRIDSFGNDLPYDFRNIKFRRWGLNYEAVEEFSATRSYAPGNVCKYNYNSYVIYGCVKSFTPGTSGSIPSDTGGIYWIPLFNSAGGAAEIYWASVPQDISFTLDIGGTDYSYTVPVDTSQYEDMYTFNLSPANTDFTVTGEVMGNTVGIYVENGIQSLNNSVFQSYGNDQVTVNNSIAGGSHDNTVEGNFRDNIAGIGFAFNFIGGNFRNSRTGDSFTYCSLGKNITDNTLGSRIYGCVFGNGIQNISVGDTVNKKFFLNGFSGQALYYGGVTAITSDYVKQDTGSGTLDVMSQAAVTEELNLKANLTDLPPVVQESGLSTTDVMSQKAVSDLLDTKFNTASIAQDTGQSTDMVMSQKAVTDALQELDDSKFSNSSVVQTTGSSQDTVMSQDASTRAITGTLYREVTYEGLLTMVNSSTLVAGRMYIITDYSTVYIQPVTGTVILSAPVEPLCITAASSNRLYPTATSTVNPGDVIYYDIQNNTSRYAWVNASLSKGVIYRRIDSSGNDLPYDFKAVMFSRNGQNFYTFHLDIGGGFDYSSSINVYSNRFERSISEGKYILPDNCFICPDSSVIISNNVIGSNSVSSTIRANFSGNITGVNFSSNVITGYFQNNTVANNFHNNTVSGNVSSNSFANDFYSNVLNDNFTQNNVDNGFTGNTVGENFNYYNIKSNITGIDFTSVAELYGTDYSKVMERGQKSADQSVNITIIVSYYDMMQNLQNIVINR
jgi:hypothetical protein